MYIGADFLIDRGGTLYLSEVNTGVPAGATEYDLVFRSRHGQTSGIFDRIEALAQETYGCGFAAHIRALPWIDDLVSLKIWMDGRGPRPKDPHPALRLEDKWVQYSLLSESFPMIPSWLWDDTRRTQAARLFSREGRMILKRRLARGGKGLQVVNEIRELDSLRLPLNLYLMQPFVDSRIGRYALSIRAAAFAGRFLCMFASLAPHSTSNHGIRFLVQPGETLSLIPEDFRTRKIVQKAWEAEIFYKEDIPEYLYQDIWEERIAEALLCLPQALWRRIKRLSGEISALYSELKFPDLPLYYIEEAARD